MLKLVVPLDRVSLKVYGGDVDHGCIRSLVEAKISFSVRDPPGWVSIFPSKEVHPHAWVLLLTSQEHRSAYGAGGNKRRKKDNSGSDLQLEGCGIWLLLGSTTGGKDGNDSSVLRLNGCPRVASCSGNKGVGCGCNKEGGSSSNRGRWQRQQQEAAATTEKKAATATEEDGRHSNRRRWQRQQQEDDSGSN
ncbi:hypothetical protein BHM03_00038377 [Ensete ventricosum]|nr:hypothetical protein BHM03_00038377 [Ensete ventricosum]